MGPKPVLSDDTGCSPDDQTEKATKESIFHRKCHQRTSVDIWQVLIVYAACSEFTVLSKLMGPYWF